LAVPLTVDGSAKGPIWWNSISAENFASKISSTNFHPKATDLNLSESNLM
jgi:hypothetical protein